MLNFSKNILLRKNHSRIIYRDYSSPSKLFPNYKFIDVIHNDGICKILFNKEKTCNALCSSLFKEVSDALRIIEESPEIKLTAVGGKGEYFSCGIDIREWYEKKPKGLLREKHIIADNLKNFLRSFIRHKKPLIGAFNGPAVGGGANMMTWFDYNICSNTANFVIPYVKYGLTPIDLNGYYFPRILGPMKAKEILMFERPISATEAKDLNLVNEVVDSKIYWEVVDERLKEFASKNQQNMREIKRVLHLEKYDEIDKWSLREIDIFVENIGKSNFYNEIAAYFSKKNRH
uniref:Enoyl-CoA delta isomerase 2, mitochondrial (inferred by orthology to a human protein) n=1 Tax=Strongyloides venezuelensis TaxID=75913 RepID=A0A0K0FZ38_STRVS